MQPEEVNEITKKLLIAAPRNLSGTTKMLVDEAKRIFDVRFAPLYDITLSASDGKLRILHEGQNITDIDYFLPRIDSFRAYYGYQIVNAFDAFPAVKKPYSAKTVTVAHDKFLTTAELIAKKIPVPPTYLLKTKKSISALVEKINFPIMIKLMAGSGGVGVMYAANKEEMESVIQSMNVLKQEVLVQEYVSSGRVEDLRLLVAGGDIIGAMKRVARPGETRANIKMGGKGVRYEPTPEIKELAVRSAEAIGAKICAIDIIESKSGPLVIEANINPGIRGLAKATDTNIARKIIAYVSQEIGS